MKRAFTLIEMMVVIAVLVTLMLISIRIGRIGSDTEARTTTITRMQRVENCLSGFHAAFGCYPPVQPHGNSEFSRQRESVNWGNENDAWEVIEPLCRVQPFGCRYPSEQSMDETVELMSDLIREMANEEDFPEDLRERAQAGVHPTGASEVEGKLSSKKQEFLWSEIKLFQYGVMSFLLPRYLVMTGGTEKYYVGSQDSKVAGGYRQWTKNNDNLSNPFTGRRLDWGEIFNSAQEYREWERRRAYNHNLKRPENAALLASIPSQAICARWLPNLEGCCRCSISEMWIFGINISDGYNLLNTGSLNRDQIYAFLAAVFPPDEKSPYTDQYFLDGITVIDGWYRELYYHSKAPYQSYTLWSAGPDGRTFPPWIARDRLGSGDELKLAVKWTKDDIIQLNN